MSSDIKFTDYIDLEEILDDAQDLNEFEEAVQEGIYETDVMYYTEAIKFLAEHDPSLKTSLELVAHCSLESLSSEILASALLQELLQDEIPDLADYWNSNKEEDDES